MTVSTQLAKSIRDFYNGGNWTGVNLKETLTDITWQEAITKVSDLNTIAMLVFHINYYVDAVLGVLRGGPLKASDKYSFDLQPLTSDDDWQKLKEYVFSQAELLATELEKLDERTLSEVFSDEKYGTYFRNVAGVVEHAHYHLGQIVIIKKMIRQEKK